MGTPRCFTRIAALIRLSLVCDMYSHKPQDALCDLHE